MGSSTTGPLVPWMARTAGAPLDEDQVFGPEALVLIDFMAGVRRELALLDDDEVLAFSARELAERGILPAVATMFMGNRVAWGPYIVETPLAEAEFRVENTRLSNGRPAVGISIDGDHIMSAARDEFFTARFIMTALALTADAAGAPESDSIPRRC